MTINDRKLTSAEILDLAVQKPKMQREPCPYCGQDAGTGPWAHATREGCVLALKSAHTAFRRRVNHLVTNNVVEVTNHIGGVIGYELHLSPAETEKLWRMTE